MEPGRWLCKRCPEVRWKGGIGKVAAALVLVGVDGPVEVASLRGPGSARYGQGCPYCTLWCFLVRLDRLLVVWGLVQDVLVGGLVLVLASVQAQLL